MQNIVAQGALQMSVDLGFGADSRAQLPLYFCRRSVSITQKNSRGEGQVEIDPVGIREVAMTHVVVETERRALSVSRISTICFSIAGSAVSIRPKQPERTRVTL